MPRNRILLIDDEELVLEELAETFEFEGFDVMTVSSSEEALNLGKLEDIRIMVSDLKMPGLNGIEMFKAMKARPDFNAQAILLSGHGAQDAHDEALECGFFACLSKPVDILNLVSVVSDAWNK